MANVFLGIGKLYKVLKDLLTKNSKLEGKFKKGGFDNNWQIMQTVTKLY